MDLQVEDAPPPALLNDAGSVVLQQRTTEARMATAGGVQKIDPTAIEVKA